MTQPVNFTPDGPPETVLPPEPTEITDAIAAAGRNVDDLARVVLAHPSSLSAWAALAARVEETAASPSGRAHAYSAYRVGYHRGLDALRKNGWSGSGHVRRATPSNRGFLACLDGLGRLAAQIGEHDEAARVAEFLRQLDPDWRRPGS